VTPRTRRKSTLCPRGGERPTTAAEKNVEECLGKRSKQYLQAISAVNGRRPTLQASHADRRQVLDFAVQLDLDAGLVVLLGAEEERAVDERVSVVDGHYSRADDARHPVHLIGSEGGEDEDTRLVIAHGALVLHLDVVGVDLVFGQHVEGAVVGSALENAPSGIVPSRRKRDALILRENESSFFPRH